MFKTIAQKSLLAGCSVLGLIGMCGALGVWAALTLANNLDQVRRSDELLASHLESDMMHDALRSDVFAALAATDPSTNIALADVLADLQEHATAFRSYIARSNELATTDEQRTALADVEAPLNQYIANANRIAALVQSDPSRARTELAAFMDQFAALEAAMARVSDVLSAAGARTQERAHGDEKMAVTLLTVVFALSILVFVMLAAAARRQVITPLRDMAAAMERLAGGDHSGDALHALREDEIGALGRALEKFKAAAIEKIRVDSERERERSAAEAERKAAEAAAQARSEALVAESFGAALSRLAKGDLTFRIERADLPAAYRGLQQDFNAAVQQLRAAIQKIGANAACIHGGAGEITRAADDLSRRTEQQAASLEETAAALDEITATVRKTADGANRANAVVSMAHVDAETSGKVVQETVAAMAEIEKSSKQISQIIGVIDEIAFQTNLLALNAGVEAARAGEAGRGFAVVASEVRALAQRSSEAAKEIKGLISASSQHVETGVDLVGEAGKALQLIVSKVGQISGLVSEIAASAHEQSTALAEVNTAINQMDQVTQQNAAMVEQSTAASHSLTQEANDLAALIQQFDVGQSDVVPDASARNQRTPRRERRSSPTRGALALRPSEDWQEM